MLNSKYYLHTALNDASAYSAPSTLNWIDYYKAPDDSVTWNPNCLKVRTEKTT